MDLRLDELRRKRAAGEHYAALRLVREILQEPGTLTDRDLCEVARVGAGAAIASEDYFMARRFAREELRYAEAAGDPALVAIGQFHYGTTEMHIGDTHQALPAFQRFAELDTPPNPALDRYRASCAFNTGTAYMQRRDYERALLALGRAVEFYDEQNNVHGVIDCRLQEAWALLLDGRAEAAGYLLERVVALLAEHPNDDLQLSCLCHRALYYHRLGEHPRAVELCQEVFLPGRVGVTHYHLSEAAWITGECGLAKGQLREAGIFADLAMDHALRAKWPWLMNRANELRGRVIQAGGQTA